MRAAVLAMSALAAGGVMGGCARAPIAAEERGADPAAGAATIAAATVAAPETSPAADAAPPRLELPRGGRALFPRYRIVGFCGTPGAPALGRLHGNLAARAKALAAIAAEYGGDREIMPAFELIAVVAQESRGKDGMSRRRVADSVVEAYLEAARAAKAILLLNIQPGHSDFLSESKHFERYLREPDVGLALDPEWAVSDKQRPGASFGTVTGAVIDEVATWLSALVREADLPEKALVFHQVNSRVVTGESDVALHEGVALVKSVDGLGRRSSKIKTYDALVKGMPDGVHAGFKLFFEEDVARGKRLMTPKEVLSLTPTPEYVMYE